MSDKICQKMKKIPMLFFHIFPIMKNPTIISQTRQKNPKGINPNENPTFALRTHQY